MMGRIAKLGEVSEADAKRIMSDIYKDGIVSRGEAEALFLMKDSLSQTDPLWGEQFIEIMKDFLLTREAPEGWVNAEEAEWLIAQINQNGDISLDDIDLLLSLLRYAEGAPENLSRFALNAVSTRIKAHGSAAADMVERMRRALFAPAGEAGIWITQHEATILFETNDAIAFSRNDPAWNDMFARAIGNHLLARAHPSPQTEADALSREVWLQDTSSNAGGFLSKVAGSFANADWFSKVTIDPKKAEKARQVANEIALREAENITPDENAWFMKRLGWDQKISPAERALVTFLQAELPGFTYGLAVAA